MQNIQSKFIDHNNNKVGFIIFLKKYKKFIIPFILILLYILLYFLVDITSQSFVAHDEGLYARRSRLLEESYNWFSSPFPAPHHKTIGSYWAIALFIRIFGNSELALRLPSILASFICLYITYLIALKITNKNSSLLTVFSLSSMPLWIQYSRYASPDILFVLCILLIIFFFLKFIDSSHYKYKYLYIFISGLFISTAFFIRSYMVFVPLFGLIPFLLYHLSRTKNIFKVTFSLGILIGSIPVFLNLYYSYRKFGISAITSLFNFTKEKAIGDFDFNDFLLIPLKYLYLTFPIGLILLTLLSLTRSKKRINYPLLTYCYPAISLAILLCMSSTYPHYFLFLLPSLSIIFAHRLESYSFKFSISKNSIKYSLSFLIILLSCLILVFMFYKNDFLIPFTYRKILLIYIISTLLLFSFIVSLKNLFDTRISKYDLTKFFYSISIPQLISISLLYNFGILGSPNIELKSFLNDTYVSSIVRINTIYLYNVDSKINTLLKYYLPSSKVVNSNENLDMYDFIITSDRNLIYDREYKIKFELIKEFNNQLFLMNIIK